MNEEVILNKFGISENNEDFRRNNGYPTIESLLGGKEVEDLIPSPLPCECGHFPLIIRIEKEHTVRCQGCNISYTFEANYSKSILQWNLRKTTPFSIRKNNSFHPYLPIKITDDIGEIRKVTKAMSAQLSRNLKTKSKREKNLVKLMIDWNNYALRMAQLYRSTKEKFER